MVKESRKLWRMLRGVHQNHQRREADLRDHQPPSNCSAGSGEGGVGGPQFGLPSSIALHQLIAHSSVTANASGPLPEDGKCWNPSLHHQRLVHGAPTAVKSKEKRSA